MRVTYKDQVKFEGPVHGVSASVIASEVAAEMGVPVAELTLELSPSEVKAHVRREIEAAAGDLPSLVGTVSDGSGLLLEMHALLVAALSGVYSFAELRAVADEQSAKLQPLLDQIAAGEVVLPHHVKGAENVLADVAARSTTVSNVLIAAAGE